MEWKGWSSCLYKEADTIAAELIQEEIDLLSRDGQKPRFRAVAQKRWNITVTYAILTMISGIFSKLADIAEIMPLLCLITAIAVFVWLYRKGGIVTGIFVTPFVTVPIAGLIFGIAYVCNTTGPACMILFLLVWILRMALTTNAKACKPLVKQSKRDPSIEFRQLVRENVLDPEVPARLPHRLWFQCLLVLLALLPGLLLPSFKKEVPQAPRYQENGLIYEESKEYYILVDCVKDFTQTDVFVPDQINGRYVAGVASGAFMNETTIKTVRLPDFIVQLGAEAFSGCTNLQSIVIPSAVTEIRGNCFEYCTSLTNVTLHEGITAIHGYAFRNCTSLESIQLPPHITEIRGYCFENCTSLRSIVIPEGVTRIAAHAFMGCDALEEVLVPSTVTELGSSAFRECPALMEIVIPQGASVDERTFKDSPTKVTRK